MIDTTTHRLVNNSTNLAGTIGSAAFELGYTIIFTFTAIFTIVNASCQRHSIHIKTFIPIYILRDILNERRLILTIKLKMNLLSTRKLNLRSLCSHLDTQCCRGNLNDIINYDKLYSLQNDLLSEQATSALRQPERQSESVGSQVAIHLSVSSMQIS